MKITMTVKKYKTKVFMIINDLETFKSELKKRCFHGFWMEFIKTFVSKNRPDLNLPLGKVIFDHKNKLFSINNINELYEISLAESNKIDKKNLGKYFTPKDVAEFMSDLLLRSYNDENIFDVAAGTGNLIISFLEKLSVKKIQNLLVNKKIHLLDIDKTALEIAKVIILTKFTPTNDVDFYSKVHQSMNIHNADFLDSKTKLPLNSVVISNPPYGRSDNLRLEDNNHFKTYKTKELYSLFTEKIVMSSRFSVIITPQSYIGSDKFKSLREVLSTRGGDIYAFDNVPAGVFNGRKKGIFNSNTANSVRAAIICVNSYDNGFRISPMIRFKNTEREKVFKSINKTLPNKRQRGSQSWKKIPKDLYRFYNTIEKLPKLKEYISEKQTKFALHLGKTPRYYISASVRPLSRAGLYKIYFESKADLDLVYATLNSSITYFWWRVHDGGITLTRKVLYDTPILPFRENKKELLSILNFLQKNENNLIVSKTNVSDVNENFKIPSDIKIKLNNELLKEYCNQSELKNLEALYSNNFTDIHKLWT